MNRFMPFKSAVAALALVFACTAQAQGVINLYTARHYAGDETLYAAFTRATGIKVNRIEGGEDALFERIRSEGANSPADVFLTVDMGRLWRVDQAGIFQPVKSALLESRIPAAYRDPDGRWFGFSARARIIAFNRDLVKPGEIRNYEDLADARWKGQVCTRSSAHPYNLSLTASMIAHLGETLARQWVQGVKNNLARDPRGGDTDQVRAAAAGECALAVTNQYYLVRLMKSKRPEDQEVMRRIGIVWPNQDNRGTHMNISGGGLVRTAPNRDNGIRFLEFLASDEAQRYFADGNNEWPTVPAVKVSNPELASLGAFRQDGINVVMYGRLQAAAQKLNDLAGFK